MPTEAAHLKKAENNQAFLDTIGDGHAEWIVTVAFYKAVHLVEAVFSRAGLHSEDHKDRNERLRDDYVDIYREYKPLHDMCIWVRYTERGISAKDAREKYVTGRLSKVEALIHTELAKPRPVPPAALKPAQRVRAKR